MALADTDSMWQRSGWERAPVARRRAPRRSAGATLWHVLLFALVAFAGYKAWQSSGEPLPANGQPAAANAPCRATDDAGQRAMPSGEQPGRRC